MNDIDNLRSALSQIAKIAANAAGGVGGNGGEYRASDVRGVCTPKFLPPHLRARAARTATEVNPQNAPIVTAAAEDESVARAIANPLSIVVLTAKYWGPDRRTLTVSFMEQTPPDLRNRILSHMNAWQCAINFVYTAGTGQVRISFGPGGFWSYLGTDILHIATNRQTMNLEGFSMSTDESEYKRVVRHETGHTLGFPHEHMRRELVARIDPQKAYPYFLRTQGWNKATVDAQVLTPLDDRSIFGTPADQTSIMCYQLPGDITKDGKPIEGGTDINPTDRSFCQRIYVPSAGATTASQGPGFAETSYDVDSGFVEEPVLVG